MILAAPERNQQNLETLQSIIARGLAALLELFKSLLHSNNDYTRLSKVSHCCQGKNNIKCSRASASHDLADLETSNTFPQTGTPVV